MCSPTTSESTQDTMGRPGSKGSGVLTVEFLGEHHRVAPGSHLSFGRLGDIHLDTQLELPEIAGWFRSRGGLWWLESALPVGIIEGVDQDSMSSVNVAPRRLVPIGFSSFWVRLDVGRARYEMSASVDDPPPVSLANSSGDGRSLVSLNEEQLQLLVVLAESRLRGEAIPVLPSNAAAAARLGWTLTKLNRKLDHLCLKFAKLGVPGLRGSTERLASGRRRALVEYCVCAKVIAVDDLAKLPNAPR